MSRGVAVTAWEPLEIKGNMLQVLAVPCNSGRGKADQHDAVQRGHRPEQPPAVDRRDIAIAERRIIPKGEVEQIGLGRGRSTRS